MLLPYKSKVKTDKKEREMHKPSDAKKLGSERRRKERYAHVHCPKVPAGSRSYEKRTGEELAYFFKDLFSGHSSIISEMINHMRYTRSIKGEQT